MEGATLDDRMRTILGTLAVATALPGCASLSSSRDNDRIEAVAPGLIDERSAWRRSVLEAGRRVADWQLVRLDRFDYVSTFRDHMADSTDWIQGTLYAGPADFADATGDARYRDAVIAHGEAQAWGYGDRPRHADDDVIGQAWLWAGARAEGGRDVSLRRWTGWNGFSTAPSDVPMIFDETPGSGPVRCGGVGAMRCSCRRRSGQQWGG